MNSHELAKQLLAAPPMKIVVSIDIATKVVDSHGDETIAKLFAEDIVECIVAEDAMIIQLESVAPGHYGLDVVTAISEAQAVYNRILER